MTIPKLQAKTDLELVAAFSGLHERCKKMGRFAEGNDRDDLDFELFEMMKFHGEHLLRLLEMGCLK